MVGKQCVLLSEKPKKERKNLRVETSGLREEDCQRELVFWVCFHSVAVVPRENIINAVVLLH